MSNPVALAFIKARESCKLLAYRDQAGRWTIGWGATGPAITAGTQWTQGEADADLAARLARVETAVSMATQPVILTQAQEAALMSLAYNIGVYAFSQSHVAQFVKAKNWLAAAKAMLGWDHVAGVEDKGLFKRRCEEAALLLG